MRKTKHDPLRFIRLRIMDDDFDRAIINSLNTLVFDYDYMEIIDVLRDISMNVKRTDSVVLTMMSKG